jgi:pimeloyl-ACP methyl ester carboxylesterase
MDLIMTASCARKVLGCLLIPFLPLALYLVQAEQPSMVPSKDGTMISYQIFGAGEPTLVFVHGWSCDARYWRNQVPVFSKTHRIVTMDLAGHGHSGSKRTQYSMLSFGDDVKAVVEAIGADQVILIGHSMAGAVIAEAARLMPNRVVGLIGVDTLENVEHAMTAEELEQIVAPLRKDFQARAGKLAAGMISETTDPQLRDWIVSDMSSAPPAVAVSAMHGMMSQYVTGDIARLFEEIKVPVLTIKADNWPVNCEANQRHMTSFNSIVLKDTDHFLMLDRPVLFNQTLARAIWKISDPGTDFDGLCQQPASGDLPGVD